MSIPRPGAKTRRVATIGCTAALAFALGGVAFGAWSSTGTGSASAKAGSVLAPTTSPVDMTAVTTGLLYPGGAAGDVKITVNNPNPFPVKVTNVNGNGTATGCTTPAITFTNQAPSTGNSVAANGSATLTLSGAVTMGTTASNDCQNATITIPVSVVIASG